MSVEEYPLDEEEFWNWFVENAPLRGKVATMKKITAAFPEGSFTIRNSWPPYALSLYSTKAAVFMNKWKESGKITTKKSGNTYIYDINIRKCGSCKNYSERCKCSLHAFNVTAESAECWSYEKD